MAGKVTYLRGRHITRTAQYTQPVSINDIQRASLDRAIGRALSKDELERIATGLQSLSGLKRTDDAVTGQDLRRTLESISKLGPDEALAAMNDCDSSARALLKEALWFDCGLREQGMDAYFRPPAELVTKAALIALGRIVSVTKKGGRPTNGHQRFVAQFAVNTWREFGQTDLRLWYSAGDRDTRLDKTKTYRSPLIAWTAVLFAVSGEKSNDSQIKKLLESETSDR